MKSVLGSFKPKYCELIASGKKTLEIRKNRPKIDVSFKIYIYCTKPKKYVSEGSCYVDELYKMPSGTIKCGCSMETTREYYMNTYNGKVIGEFVCDRITFLGNVTTDEWKYLVGDVHEHYKRIVIENACLSEAEVLQYGNGKCCYGWHISDLVIYDKPKDLDEFEKPCSHDCKNCKYWYSGSPIDYEPPCCEWEDCVITRPPQSWCYVEELEV